LWPAWVPAVAGEVADGYLAHGFTTPDYLRAVTLPQLEVGILRGGRSRDAIEVSVPVLLQLGESDEDISNGRESLRNTISFYGSTPAYRPVLAYHGFGEVGDELHRLSKQGGWDNMVQVVPDEVVDLMGVYGKPSDVGREIVSRLGGVADRIQLVAPADDEDALALLESIRGASQ
jgi:alkanesulfonate monooxygenase SsuD/methylene tetrahydromethanopterin reductase-like flavin-dependent oxidoreductase (luciferase family)